MCDTFFVFEGTGCTVQLGPLQSGSGMQLQLAATKLCLALNYLLL